MKHFIVIGCMIAGMWLWMDYSATTSGQQQYALDMMCADETHSAALKQEAERIHERLIERGVTMDQTMLNEARAHWFRNFNVNSYEQLKSNTAFQMTCHFNACLYEGREVERCTSERLVSCLNQGLSESECFPDA